MNNSYDVGQLLISFVLKLKVPNPWEIIWESVKALAKASAKHKYHLELEICTNC